MNYGQLDKRLAKLAITFYIEADELVMQTDHRQSIDPMTQDGLIAFLRQNTQVILRYQRLKALLQQQSCSLADLYAIADDAIFMSQLLDDFLDSLSDVNPNDHQDRVKALLALLRADEKMRRGCVPKGYSKKVHCQHCGWVKLWPSCPDQVLACPWCNHPSNCSI